MGDFIEPVKIETVEKSEMLFSYCIESKILYMRFLTAQLNRTLM